MQNNEVTKFPFYLLLSIQPLFCFLVVPDLLFDPLRAIDKLYVNLFFVATSTLFAVFLYFVHRRPIPDKTTSQQLVVVFYLTALAWTLLQAADFHVVVGRAAWGAIYLLLVVSQLLVVAK
jgi:hypothetical protein